MALSIWLYDSTDGSTCDKCRKQASKERPLVVLQVGSRRCDERQFVQVHEDCLFKGIAKEKVAAVKAG